MAELQPGKSLASARQDGGDLPHLAEAKRLYSLLSDGAKPAGFHISDGYWLRDASTKRFIRSSYTSEWRPARDVNGDGSYEPRKLTSYHLAYHLRGKYSIAWSSPSWTSLIVLDIDRPHVAEGADIEAHWRADAQRDDVLASVWDAFGCDEDKQPVVLATPGGGYHLYFPLCRTGDPDERERTWPAAWAREWFEHHIKKSGLSLRPGTLELYPSGVRLRAPCGRGTALLEARNPNHSDELRLEPVHAQYITVIDGKTGEAKRSLRRRVGPMTAAFCDAIDAARRPLEAWLGNEERAWSPTWGPGALPYGTRAIGAMAEIIEYMREQEAQLVEQGFILPGQLEDIHNTARAQLDPTERRRTDFPSALIDIIDAIATREKVRLEHAVRLAALDEERERLVDQGNLLLIEIEATTATARLHELAPRWSLHNLDLDVNPSNPGQNGLYSATNEITEVLADFVFPIVELWHRDLHLSLATHSRITALQNPSPSASLYRRAVAVRDLSEHLIDELGSLGQPASGVSTVAFSFRRPPVPTNPLLGGEGGDYTSFHHADPGRGNAVWDSIDAAIDSPTGVGRVSFSVRPEDIYLGDGGLFRLSCSDANPLIRRIGLAVVSSSQVLGVQDGVPAPYVGLGVEIDASPEQLIATFAGPVLYGNHVESGPPTMSNVPAVPAEDADSDANANAINMVELAWARPDVEPIGRSPFADFSFNFNAVFGHLTIFDEFAEQGTELVVVMEVEHTSAALGEQPNRLDWVPTCQIENSSAACMDGYDNDRDGEIDCADAGCAQHCP